MVDKITITADTAAQALVSEALTITTSDEFDRVTLTAGPRTVSEGLVLQQLRQSPQDPLLC